MDFSPLRPYTWALLLGLFVPSSWILAITLGPGVVVFAVAGVAVVPLAWFLGLATEELGSMRAPAWAVSSMRRSGTPRNSSSRSSRYRVA